jgi:hypothetical protein
MTTVLNTSAANVARPGARRVLNSSHLILRVLVVSLVITAIFAPGHHGPSAIVFSCVAAAVLAWFNRPVLLATGVGAIAGSTALLAAGDGALSEPLGTAGVVLLFVSICLVGETAGTPFGAALSKLLGKYQRPTRDGTSGPVATSGIGRLSSRVWLTFAAVTTALDARLLLTPGGPEHGDISYPWSTANLSQFAKYTFNQYSSTSNLENVDRALLFVPVTDTMRLLGLSPGYLHKFIFIALPLVSLIATYKLCALVANQVSESPSTFACLFGSVLFTVSPWVLEQVQADLFWLAYALTPALLLSVWSAFQIPSVFSGIKVAIIVAIIASTPQYLIFTSLLLLAMFVWRIRHPEVSDAPQRQLYLWATGVVGATMLLSSSWLLPTGAVLYNGYAISPGYTNDQQTVAMFSRNSTGTNVLRGFDQWITWYQGDQRLRVEQSGVAVILTALVPLVAYGVLLVPRVRALPLLRIIASVATAFAVLGLGTRIGIYDWLIFKAPVLNSFGWVLRVPGKLTYLLWVFYAPAIAVAGTLLLERFPVKAKRARAVPFFLLAVMLLLVPGWKALIFFNHYYLPVGQPTPYKELGAALAADKLAGRAMYLAPYADGFGRNSLGYETSPTWNPSRLSAATPALSSPVPAIGYYHLTYRDWQESLYAQVNAVPAQRLGSELLAPSNIRWLVYTDDIVGAAAEGARELQRLEHSDLKLVNVFGGYIYLFQVAAVAPMVRDTSDSLSVKQVDPTRYDLLWKGQSASATHITFAQPLDSLWIIKSGSTIVHGTAAPDGRSMVFTLPAGHRGKARLEYLPQSYYEAGLNITAASVAGLALLSLGTVVGRRRRNEGEG